MTSTPESWLSKLKWRLDHRLIVPAVRAITELSPTTDPEEIRTLVGALSYGDQDVREAAARTLEHSGSKAAEGPLWREVAAALDRAAGRARDDEERLNMERAAATIEARLEGR